MTAYTYSRKHGAYIKECSCCKTVTIGNSNQEESIDIFKKMYSVAPSKSDGFQSFCWYCASARNTKLGVTRVILEDMLKAQGGKCGICNREISIERGARRGIRACVDHNDLDGNVRGLLCDNCNLAIGLLDHKVDALNRAITYLCRNAMILPFRRRM